jgi:hypothetical protein
VSTRNSDGFSSIAPISSSSGRIATVQADVWMRPCASVAGTRCTRCAPDSNLSFEYAPAPTTRLMISLVAAVLAGALAQHLDAPALALGVARVHAEQVAGEDRGFVTAGAGADFEKDVRLVARIARDQQLRELRGLRVDPLLEGAELVFGQRAQLRVGFREHRMRRRALGLEPQEFAKTRADRLEPRVLHRQVAKAVRPADDPGSASNAPTSSNRSAVFSRRRRMESFISRGRAGRSP